MLKKWMKRALIFLFIYVGIIFGLVFVSALPFSKEVCTNDAYPYYVECIKYNIIFYIPLRFLELLVENNWIFLVAVTAVIAWFTWKLRDSTNKLWEAGENQLKSFESFSERELRAYIGIDEDLRENSPQGKRVPGYLLLVAEVKNFGKTPAYNVDVRLNGTIFDNPLHPKFAFPEPQKSQIATHTLNPGQSSYVMCRIPDALLSPVNLEKLKRDDSDIQLFIFGYVTYSDVFGKEVRRTNFRNRIVLPSNEDLKPAWFFCDKGNDST